MACGVDWWTVAAGRAVDAGRRPTAAPASTDPAWWTAASRGQLQRIGLGLAGILVIAAYVWVDGALEATGRQSGLQPAADPTGRSDQLAAGPATPSAPESGADASSPGPVVPEATEGAQPGPVAPTETATPVAPPQPTRMPAATATPPTASTPDPTLPPSSLPTTVTLEGTGSAVTEPIEYPGGSVRVRSVASGGGAGCYYIGTFSATDPVLLPADASIRTTVLFLEGAGSAEGWVDLVLAPGRYVMEIESDCAWTVTIAPA